LKQFGSLENIRNASVEKLIALPGITRSLAEKLRTDTD
jgi:excinuclease UvrABC nuclease subunit